MNKDCSSQPFGDAKFADIKDTVYDEKAKETTAEISNPVRHHGTLERCAHFHEYRTDICDGDDNEQDCNVSVVALVPSGNI